MQSPYMRARNIRHDGYMNRGHTRGGKLYPVLIQHFDPSEGGQVRQRVGVELGPIAGRLLSPIRMRVTSVFVPALAIDEAKGEGAHPGNVELFREKIVSGVPYFDLEPESEISKALRIKPVSISGAKHVNEAARIAHNVAVNFLRRRIYHKAAQILATNTAITPALFTRSLMDILGGVLNPEGRVDGAVRLQGDLPVRGIGVGGFSPDQVIPDDVRETDNIVVGGTVGWRSGSANFANDIFVIRSDNGGNPQIYATFDGADKALKLSDFHRAERMDMIVRGLDQVIKDHPEHGEAMVERWIHGLFIENARMPWVSYEREFNLGMNMRVAMDSADLDASQTDHMSELSFATIIPKTEFGGELITFCEVLPDEVNENQPHPFLAAPMSGRNHVVDEMAVDPVRFNMRQADSDVPLAAEGTPAFYLGNNHELRRYMSGGWNDLTDPSTVQFKSSLWQIPMPVAHSPDSVVYPDVVDHYPFRDWQTDMNVVTIDAMTVARVQTPIHFGPSPVEEIEVIETENLFEDVETP